MAFGPMSVGSEGALNLITDPTLSKENASADAKAVGDALGKKFDKSGGTVNGNIRFPTVGDTERGKKITWEGTNNGAEIYYQTTGQDKGSLVLNLLNDANCLLQLASGGVFRSYFTPWDGNFHGNVNGRADTAGMADKAGEVGGYKFRSQTNDPGAGSALESGVVLFIYE